MLQLTPLRQCRYSLVAFRGVRDARDTSPNEEQWEELGFLASEVQALLPTNICRATPKCWWLGETGKSVGWDLSAHGLTGGRR